MKSVPQPLAPVPPPCIGRGVDPDSRQAIPLAQCARCSDFNVCNRMRTTGALEDIARRANPEDRSRRFYHDGTPARGWWR